MFKAKHASELELRVDDEIGALFYATKILAEKGLNIIATCNWTEGEEAVLHLLMDDNLRAMDELKRQGYGVSEKPVILLECEHKPGVLKVISEKLMREDIDIRYLYSTAGLSQGRCLVIINTIDNNRALVLLNED